MGADIQSEVMRLRRSVELLVKLKVEEARRDRKQVEMILWLSSLGCSPSEIASLLNTTTTNVSPVLSRARKGKVRKAD